MDTIQFYVGYLISQFTGYPVIIRVVALVVTILVFTYLLIGLRLIQFNHGLNREERKKLKFKDKYENLVFSILTSSERLSIEDVLNKLNLDENQSLSDWDKDQMISLTAEVRDANPDTFNDPNYHNLVEGLALVEFLEKRLKKEGLGVSQTSLRKFESISTVVPASIFSRKAQVKNNGLRKHAKTKYIKHSAHDGFRFLDDGFDKDFNYFDGVRIHNVLKYKAQRQQLPSLMRWVTTATNEKYRSFLIREIGFFGQADSADQLLNLFKQSQSPLTRAQIVETLKVLNYKDAIPAFIKEYEFSDLPTQHNIVDAMGHFNTKEGLNFLEAIYKTNYDDELLIKIVNNIYKMDYDHKKVEQMKEEVSSEFKKSIFDYHEIELATK